MNRRIIDLSIAIEAGLPSDPEMMIPKIDYLTHAQGAEQMELFFPGLKKEQLPKSLGWAIEFVQLTTHSGTHLDAPFHYHPFMDKGAPALTIDQVPLDGSPDLIIKTGQKLDVKWTLKNIGTKKWEAATFGWIAWEEKVRSDIPANQLLSTSPMPLSIGLGGVDVLPKEWVELGVELTAPAAFDGHDPIYITVRMALVAHGTKFCTPWVQVEIIRPGMTP